MEEAEAKEEVEATGEEEGGEWLTGGVVDGEDDGELLPEAVVDAA